MGMSNRVLRGLIRTVFAALVALVALPRRDLFGTVKNAGSGSGGEEGTIGYCGLEGIGSDLTDGLLVDGTSRAYMDGRAFSAFGSGG